MINNDIEKLADLLKASVLTPFNLIQYLKIEEYRNLNISKNNEMLIAKIDFEVYNKIKSMFYVFDYDDKLLEVYNIGEDGIKSTVYSREKEVELLLNQAIYNDENTKKCI